MDEERERKARALRQVLEDKCPGEEFTNDDIERLVDAGFLTESSFRAALPEDFKEALPSRIGVVAMLRKAFLKHIGMFPCQGFVVLTFMFFTDLYAMDL
jgi:hypothetical protein